MTEIEIRILTKEIQTGGPVLPQTASMITHLEEEMTALETSIEIIMIQTDTVMGIGPVILKARARTRIDTRLASL